MGESKSNPSCLICNRKWTSVSYFPYESPNYRLGAHLPPFLSIFHSPASMREPTCWEQEWWAEESTPPTKKKAKPGPFSHPPSSQALWVHDYRQDYGLLRAGPLCSWQTLEKSLTHPELQQPVKAVLEIAARQERCFLPSSSAGTAHAVLTSSNTQTCFLNPNNNNKKQQNPTITFLAMYPPCHDDPDI